MREQDDKYNSWVNTRDQEVVATFEDFGIPDNAIFIRNIRIKLRLRSSVESMPWTTQVSIDGGTTYLEDIYAGCDCYYATTSFNSIDFPNLRWNGDPLRLPFVPAKDINSGKFRLKIIQSSYVTSTDIDTLLVNIEYYNPDAGPAPFLDLPWDYEGKGLTFNDAALSINSYFDHEYPLLSSGLGEPVSTSGLVTNFNGERRSDQDYSLHDGYDYGKSLAKVNIGDPVLAAASGIATYINSCSSCGNMIVIDHKNGYQTRYMHLERDGLITSTPGQKVQVITRQQIGRVGATGNVSPSGNQGAHIHFGLFEDKNKDGNFEDNIPDGATDPFGWQSKAIDPWETYSFFYNGKNRTGNRSYYLWKKKIDKLNATLTSNGGVFNTGRYKVDFPKDSTNQNLTLNILSEPIAKLSNEIQSIGSTIAITAKDTLGNLVTTFKNLFTITVDFSPFDLTRYNTDTLSIYSSTDGINWTKEPTIVDYVTNTASSQINHLTHFALLAERKDTIPPTTTAALSGEQGQTNWFRGDVLVTLNAEDNTDGLGVDYTLYKVETSENTTDWATYTTPLTFTTEAHHKVQFYSVDKDENVEAIKSIEFDIDKTPPEANIHFDTQTQDMVVIGLDNSGETGITQTDLSKNKEQITITDQAGNTLILAEIHRDHGPNSVMSISSLAYNDLLTTLDTNKLRVQYSLDKTGNIRTFTQTFEIKGIVKIQLKYDSQANKTTITTNKQKVEVDGMKVLQIATEKGTLEYSY